MTTSSSQIKRENVMRVCNHIFEDSYTVFSNYASLFSYMVPPLRALEQTLCHYLLDINNRDTVLDIGPGYNLFTYYSALRNRCSLDLIDIDKKVITYQKTIIKKGNFSQIQAKRIKTRFPCDDERYSKAFCISTFEHIPNSLYVSFLDEVDRVLKPKGKVVFSFPYTSNRSSVRMIQTNQFSFPEITFNPYFIRTRLLERLNYSIQDVVYIRPRTKNIKTAYDRPYQLDTFFEIIAMTKKLEKSTFSQKKESGVRPYDGIILLVLKKP